MQAAPIMCERSMQRTDLVLIADNHAVRPPNYYPNYMKYIDKFLWHMKC
jgi:hypothetical protein